MLLVPKIYAEIALGSDFVILITSLLFRKPKRRSATSTSDPKSTKYVGYYIIGSATVSLVVVHYASFPRISVSTLLTTVLFLVLPPTPG